MKTICTMFMLATALAGCGKQGDSSPDDRMPGISVPIPPADRTPANEMEDEGEDRHAALGMRPRLSMETGVCMGEWQAVDRRGRDRIVLAIDRKGAFVIRGESSRSGRWEIRENSIILDGARLRDCGKTMAHLSWEGRQISMRRMGW